MNYHGDPFYNGAPCSSLVCFDILMEGQTMIVCGMIQS